MHVIIDILQHKSWHVGNRDARAKVERDVAAHKEAEEKKRKRTLEIVCYNLIYLTLNYSSNK